MNIPVGALAEQKARRFLESQGLQTIATNYRCKTGEIDLIMQHDQTLVFVEVRHRSNSRFPSAARSVSPAKQQKLARTAALFRRFHPNFRQCPCRFDVIAYDGRIHECTDPRWIQRAFDVSA